MIATTLVWTSVVAIIKKFAIAMAITIFTSHDLHAINGFCDYCGYAMRAWDARLVRKFVNIDDSSIYHSVLTYFTITISYLPTYFN